MPLAENPRISFTGASLEWLSCLETLRAVHTVSSPPKPVRDRPLPVEGGKVTLTYSVLTALHRQEILKPLCVMMWD